MKKILLILLYLTIVSSCGSEENADKNTEIDLCRCLAEPGNSDWAKENREHCDKVISSKMGVPDWKSVNFSQNSRLSIKWDIIVDECIDNQLENDSKKSSSIEISFEDAKAFIIKRFENIGHIYLNGKTTYINDGNLKVYYFISKSTQYTGYYCLSSLSSRKLEVLGNIDCGKDEIMSKFNNK